MGGRRGSGTGSGLTASALSSLSPEEMERVARSLSAGSVESILANHATLVALPDEDLDKLKGLLESAPTAICGGFDCG